MADHSSPRYPRVHLVDAVADALGMREAADLEVRAFKALAAECETPEALLDLLAGWIDVSIRGSGNGRET